MTEMLESSDKDIKVILIKHSNMFEINEKKKKSQKRNPSLSKQVCFKEPNGNLSWKIE